MEIGPLIQFMVTPFHSLRKPSSFAMIRIVYASRNKSHAYAADGRVSARRVRVNLGLHASSHNVERIRAGLRDQRRHCATDHALQRRRALALIDVILEELAQRVKNHPRNARVRKDAEERGVDSGVEGSYALDVIAASTPTSSFAILRIATPMFLYVASPSLTAIRVRRKSKGYAMHVAVAPAHAPAKKR